MFVADRDVDRSGIDTKGFVFGQDTFAAVEFHSRAGPKVEVSPLCAASKAGHITSAWRAADTISQRIREVINR